MAEGRRMIGGHPYRLLGVFPAPVAGSFEAMLRENGIPAYVADAAEETRPYTGSQPMGPEVYVWVPETMFARASELVGNDAGDAGA